MAKKKKRTPKEEAAHQRFGERLTDPDVFRLIKPGEPPKPKKKTRRDS